MELDSFRFPKLKKEFPFLKELPIKEGDTLKIQTSEIPLSELIERLEASGGAYYVGNEDDPEYVIFNHGKNCWKMYKRMKTLKELLAENTEIQKRMKKNLKEVFEKVNPPVEK